jgi:uncharacterized protein YcbK (DUF882 family)
LRPNAQRLIGARGLVGALAALAAAAGTTAAPAAPSAGDGDARTISFHHIHTNETLTVLYKKDGRYIPEALERINWIMRDWRKNEAIAIDPEAIDIIWEMHTELGSKVPVDIICGYRSRATNNMLRRTVGGQASQSQHITGKAIDVAFPDVPVRQMRYSALVRERGGVGYYPTSAIPFVHVDTGRVRHWPRMPRDELALLFPSGRSKHEPSDGRAITPADVRAAREKRKDLAREVAQYFDVRDRPKSPVVLAEAPPVSAPEPRLASPPPTEPQSRPNAVEQKSEQRMAVGAPVAVPVPQSPVLASILPAPSAAPSKVPLPRLASLDGAPRLLAEPRPIERPAKFTPAVLDADRSRLDMLVTLARLDQPVAGSTAQPAAAQPIAQSIAQPVARPLTQAALTALQAPEPRPAVRPGPNKAATRSLTKVASLAPPAGTPPAPVVTGSLTRAENWAPAPAWDDEHPDELSYRPFPLAPLLTQSPSPDDPVLTVMVHPDATKALELIDDGGLVLPMRLRPGGSTARLLWAHEFSGEAVSLAELMSAERPPAPAAVPERSVKTLPR